MPQRTIWISNTGPCLSFDWFGQAFVAGNKKTHLAVAKAGFQICHALAVFLERKVKTPMCLSTMRPGFLPLLIRPDSNET